MAPIMIGTYSGELGYIWMGIYIVFEIFENSVERGWIYIVFDMLLTVFHKFLFDSLHSKALFSISQEARTSNSIKNTTTKS